MVISEFLATNSNTTAVDEDGSHSDWIERQNNATADVSLNGWHLTDDKADLRKWQFPQAAPALTLTPGGRLLVWASSKNRKSFADRLLKNWPPVELPAGAPQDLGDSAEKVTFRDNVPAGQGARFIRANAKKQRSPGRSGGRFAVACGHAPRRFGHAWRTLATLQGQSI